MARAADTRPRSDPPNAPTARTHLHTTAPVEVAVGLQNRYPQSDMTIRSWRGERAPMALLLVGLLTALPLHAQEVSACAAKAALLLNFVRFSEWPASAAPAGALTLCVVGDEALESALDQMVKGQIVSGHTLDVRRVSAADEARGCALLYVDDASRGLAQRLQDLPVLTVSDAPRFSATDGIVELTLEDGHMGFSVNVDAANRSGVKLSSQLLRLARIVPKPRAR
jgi:hypothetical protein